MELVVQYVMLGLSMKLSYHSVQLIQMSLILVSFPLNVSSELLPMEISTDGNVPMKAVLPHSSKFPCFCQWHLISVFFRNINGGNGVIG